MIPAWWPFLLLALAAFRTWRLIAEDTILDGLRERLPIGLNFVRCPWCAGFWVSLAWWLAWVAWPHGSLVVAVPFAISAVLGLMAANIDPV